jgi:hypothetical protein
LSGARFSPLALRVLCSLTTVRPPWVLCGRSALGKHFPEPDPITDLDLVWHGLGQLDSLLQEVCGRLAEAGLEITTIQRDFAARSLVVAEGQRRCVLKLRAEPKPSLEPPERMVLEGVSIEVESPHDVLVDCLCALLDRPDLRDVSDVGRLVRSGRANLKRALADAPRKLEGFSPLQLAWGLHTFQVPELGLDGEDIESLRDLRSRLVQQILTNCYPVSLAS